MRRVALLLIVFFLPSLSQAVSNEALQSLAAKLERWEIEEAWEEVRVLLGTEPREARLLELASQIAFHRGDYEEARRLARSALEAGGGEERLKGFLSLIEETLGAVSPLKRYETSHFVIHLDEARDGILIGYLTETLERTCEAMAAIYGFRPKEKVRVEIFPDARSFFFASSLMAADIEKGAVGLTRFNKLMLLSPGALVHGYRWLDAISHEYLHYLIVRMTANNAPVWFHEGLAKFEESRWREGPSYLSPLHQGLLLRAIAEGKLIPFDRMEPSVIRLETPEEVQLAYAQAASAIEFLLSKAGYQGLREAMKRMAGQSRRGAKEAIEGVLGMAFEEFVREWRRFLAAKDLKGPKEGGVRRHRLKEGKSEEERLDLEEIRSIVARNRAHLGDLLRSRGRMEAAVLQYRRGLEEAPDSTPILNRLSSVLIQLKREEEALPLLQRARELSPDHPAPYANLGKAYLRLREFGRARESFLESIHLNPFDPEVHLGLAEAYERLGEEAPALKEREIARRLGQR
ncbi:MAG: tetratricopeptide repeat protein [Desulfobacterota bacterium]|nr:tetratricopeptide repeat protein [Thermodesulfobacteriota bacterium]